MLFEQKIKQVKLTANEQLIANYILSHKNQLKNISSSQIARETYTSSSTVIRFAQKLGYDGFEQLKKQYLKELQYLQSHFQYINPNIPFSQEHTIMDIAGIMKSLVVESVEDTFSLINHDTLQQAIQILKKSHHIYIYAIENIENIAKNFKYKMLRIGKTVIFEESFGNQFYHSMNANQNDCAILISYSGETSSVIKIAKILKANGVKIITITSYGENELNTLADTSLTISSREAMQSKIANFTTEYSISLILDILYSCYFSLNYKENLDYKISKTKAFEGNRKAPLTLIEKKLNT